MRLFKYNILFILILFTLLLSGCSSLIVEEEELINEEPLLKVKLADGKIELVRLEEYIAGVLVGELGSGWPEEAYAAQAIVARTYTLKYLKEKNTNIISGSYKKAQAYKMGNIPVEIRKAVLKTRGEIILYNNDYIYSWYHSSAGGRTSTATVGLNYQLEEPPYIKIVDSPDYLAPLNIKKWSYTVSTEKLIQVLSKMGSRFLAINNVEIAEKDFSGRVKTFLIADENKKIHINAAELRINLNPQLFKSTKISKIENSANQIKFIGSGYGHGVGLSQWGAYALAKMDYNYVGIIKYYYDDIEIKQLYK